LQIGVTQLIFANDEITNAIFLKVMEMKLKFGAFLIVLSTAAIIGLISFALNRSSEPLPITTKTVAPPEPIKKIGTRKTQNVTSHHNTPDVKSTASEPDEEVREEIVAVMADREPQAENSDELSKEDIQKINGIVSLSENDLARELNTLKERIEDEDLFAKLEDGELTGEKQAEAKEVLERFALLGLEGTRRKYMAIEPELKDPIYAYKESLMEIRELLNDDFDDE
jgi:hypothetical protein